MMHIYIYNAILQHTIYTITCDVFFPCSDFLTLENDEVEISLYAWVRMVQRTTGKRRVRCNKKIHGK